MAIYDGVPSIRLEGDRARALALIPEAKLLLQKLQSFTSRANVPTFSMSQRIGSDAYIYVLQASGQNIIHISAGTTLVDTTTEELPEGDSRLFPDFLSGLVFNGIIKPFKIQTPDGIIIYNAVDSFAPTPGCATMQKMPMGRQRSRRLVVRPWIAFSEWNAIYPDERDFSQYQTPRSSMWTGTMKKVVQLVMGFGRINVAKLYDPNLPKQTQDTKKYAQDVKALGVQVRFDYKFSRTHGITKAADGRLWLVEISITRGVVAMPLPIYPNSKTVGFSNRATSRGDAAMVTALDELGCLPTGEAFPGDPKVFDAKVASGDILVLADSSVMEPFYNCSAYSSSCGWAFSESGTEAHNVGYYYPDNNPIQRGAWYQVSINIGAINPNRKPGDPIASGSANLKKQSEGNLYNPPVKKGFVPVSYYEPLMNPPALITHTARPLDEKPHEVFCNTPVFVAFINGDLKVGRYFGTFGSIPHNKVDTDIFPGECIYEGDWTTTTTAGDATLPNMPYTNDIDPRRVLESYISVVKLSSKSMGFTPASLVELVDAPNYAYLFRSKIFKETTVTDTKSGEQLSAHLMVPKYGREAYYYAQGNRFSYHKGGTGTSYKFLKDPNTGYAWAALTFSPAELASPPWGCAAKNCGGKNIQRRIICTGTETGGLCSEYADSGTWLGMCAPIQQYVGPLPFLPSPQSSWDKGGDFTGSITLISSGLNGSVVMPISEATYEIFQKPFDGFLITAEHSSLGEPCAIFDFYSIGQPNKVKVIGYTPENPDSILNYPTFIGVNQP